MFKTYPWQTGLYTNLPSWLQNLNYPGSGVGDNNDLAFSTSVGNNGEILGNVNSGWFYYFNWEQYNFNLKGTTSVTTTNITGSINSTFNPSWGPVLLRNQNNTPFTLHNNVYSPYTPLNWVNVSGSLYSATLPSNCLLVGLRDYTPTPWVMCNNLSALPTNDFYYYDFVNTVYIQSSSSFSVTADLVYFNPQLQIRELSVIDENNNVNPSFAYWTNLILSSNGISFSYNISSSGSITNPFNNLYSGQSVVLSYYVPNSYVLANNNTIQYYCPTTGSVLTVDYETSLSQPPVSLFDNSQLNLNPGFINSYRSGYLFHVLSASSINVSSLWLPTTLGLWSDKNAICKDWNESIKIYGIIKDKEGLPIPWYPINCTYTSGSIVLAGDPSSSLVTTNGKGEFNCVITPTSSSFFFTVTSGTLSKSIYTTASASGAFINTTNYQNGLIILVSDTSNSSLLDRDTLWYTSLNLDGLPKRTNSLTMKSKNSSVFLYNNTFTPGTVSSLPLNFSVSNPFSINSIQIVPNSPDSLIAYSSSTQSIIQEV